jgi:hypothetical protein
MKNSTWTTYRIVGYEYDVSNDQRSAGGIHFHQVRRVKDGWQHRICQSNGCYRAYGPVRAISAEDGEARWATATNPAPL